MAVFGLHGLVNACCLFASSNGRKDHRRHHADDDLRRHDHALRRKDIGVRVRLNAPDSEQIGESDGDCSLRHDGNARRDDWIGRALELKSRPFEEHSPDAFQFAKTRNEHALSHQEHALSRQEHAHFGVSPHLVDSSRMEKA